MPHSISAAAPHVLRDYYRILSGGADAYGQGEKLRPLLSPDLEFTGSLAGHHIDATSGFLQGVSGFIATVGHIDVVQEVHGQVSSAILYDAAMPGGMVRFAEFFTYPDGVIDRLDLHYDGPDYLAKGGR